MEQNAFSNIVRDYIKKKYPAFFETISYQADGSFDCTLKNTKGKFSVWIATYNSEITLGLEAADGNSDCHTHMSFYGEEPTEQLEAMKNYLENIFSNKLLIVQSSLSGYSWTDNIEDVLKRKKKNESVQFFRWNES